jgi:hypothetical protein
MDGTSGTRAFSLMETSGYLQFPVALQAAREAEITPQYKQQLTQHFTAYQSQLRPLVNAAKKVPRSASPDFDSFKSIVTTNDQEMRRLAKDPQFPEFDRRMRIIQSQVGLLTTRPLAFEGGFERLGVSPAQRDKLDPILRKADAQLQSQQSTAFSGANLADLAEQTIASGLQTRAALRSLFTPTQNQTWDALALPTRPTSRP